jgi:urocanate hydratase
MAIQNVIGDSFRGATWVSIHNGGGVGWGEVLTVVSVWFLMDLKKRYAYNPCFWDVNNGISRRSCRNEALFAIKRAMEAEPLLRVTIPTIVADNLLDF